MRSNTTAQPVLTFWLSFSSPAPESQSISYAIADEHGFEAPMVFNGLYGSYVPGGFSPRRVGLVRGAATFPHRSRRFFFRLYQRAANGERVRVAEFPVRNSWFQNSPYWKPQDVPMEYQTNGFTFALVKAEVGATPPGSLIAPYDLQAGEWSKFRFRVSAQGQPSPGWTVNEMLICDATGNRLRVSGQDSWTFSKQFSHVEGDEIVCLHRWMFWADEPAWRLRVHFEQPSNVGCWIEYLVRPKFLDLRRPSGAHGEQTASRQRREDVSVAFLCCGRAVPEAER